MGILMVMRTIMKMDYKDGGNANEDDNDDEDDDATFAVLCYSKHTRLVASPPRCWSANLQQLSSNCQLQ